MHLYQSDLGLSWLRLWEWRILDLSDSGTLTEPEKQVLPRWVGLLKRLELKPRFNPNLKDPDAHSRLAL